MITDDIFMSIQFLDCENHCYGKIEQSEFDENIYAFFPADTNEVDPKLQIEINRMIELLNNAQTKDNEVKE